MQSGRIGEPASEKLPSDVMNAYLIQPTPFGPVGLIWTGDGGDPKIVRVLLSKPGLSADKQLSWLYPGARTSSCAEIERTAAAIRGIVEGDEIDLPLDLADLGQCGEFQRLVLRAEHAIPRGRISTYGRIARHVGKKNGARAVGNALASNPFPLIVPCHRAVRSDLHLGGYQGGVEMKRALLEYEGIRFDAAGRVSSPKLWYA
jgi:methylated-DNA-[protein]-cysteine S-methyltransferase